MPEDTQIFCYPQTFSTCMQYPQEPEEDVGLPGIGVPDGC